MKEIDAETIELLLNYIYTGRVTDFKHVSVVELFKVIMIPPSRSYNQEERFRFNHLDLHSALNNLLN